MNDLPMRDTPWFEPGTCRGKVPHPSKTHARAVLRNLVRSGTLRATHTLESYHCRHCHKWHLGNRYMLGDR